MPARRAEYADAPELEALTKGLGAMCPFELSLLKFSSLAGNELPAMLKACLDAQAIRMAARRAKYADNPELDALKKGLSNTGRRRSGPTQPEDHWTPSARDAGDASR